jgi:hypothetical protein
VDLAGDAALRAELTTARAWGVPWRRWAGWEPAEITTYEYDDAGRLIRATTVREPEWGEVDRAAAIELAAYEADLCPGCKQPQADALAHEERWVAEVTARCHSCTAAEILREKLEKRVEDKALTQASALLLRTRLMPPDGGADT